MMISRLALAALLSALLVACDEGPTADPGNAGGEDLATGDGRILLYDCPGAMLEVHYLDDAVQFAWQGMSYRLPQVPAENAAAAEARYATSDAKLWNRGSEIRVRLPDVGAMSCTQRPQDSVPRYPSVNPTDPPQ